MVGSRVTVKGSTAQTDRSSRRESWREWREYETCLVLGQIQSKLCNLDVYWMGSLLS